MIDIMSEVNTMTAAKQARMRRDFEKAAGEAPKYLSVLQISPVLEMTVGFGSELAAYKLAFHFRDHTSSRVRIEIAKVPAAAEFGPYLVVLVKR
jgi:hypothetical protein